MGTIVAFFIFFCIFPNIGHQNYIGLIIIFKSNKCWEKLKYLSKLNL